MAEVAIDRAIYEVADANRTYRFLRRNPVWRQLSEAENEANKRRIDGFQRVFRDGTTKTFRHKPR
jgi:hypothetical protein